jgi:hypothetical protein
VWQRFLRYREADTLRRVRGEEETACLVKRAGGGGQREKKDCCDPNCPHSPSVDFEG